MASARTYHVMHLLANLEVGGAESVALLLAGATDRASFRPAVCALDGPGEMALRFGDVGAETCWLRGEGRWRGPRVGLLLRLAAFLRRERVDVLHCHNFWTHVYGPFAARLARVPVVVCTRHGINLARCVGRRAALARLAVPLVSQYVAVSETVRQAMIRHLSIPAPRVSLIYNGIDTARFGNSAGSPRAEQGAVVIGCVGRLSSEKRHDLLLEALRDLPQDGPQVRACFAGDGPLRATLEAQAEALGLGSRVAFLGVRADVPEVLRSFDIFAQPSEREGLPLTVLEAMAAGLPVVATAVGGIPEVVRDGDNGILVAPGDADALREALARLIHSPEERLALGRAARSSVFERFDVQKMARQYEALYLRLLSERR